MTGGKKIASYSLSPEARGEVDYVDTSIASYMRYPCAYCMEEFYLVDPYTQRSGGCVQRLILRNKDTNARIPTNEVHGMCTSCFHDIMQRQQQERS
jgi:hypothetical protein